MPAANVPPIPAPRIPARLRLLSASPQVMSSFEDANGIPVLQRLREHLLQTLGTHGLEYPAKEFSAGPCKNAKGYGRRNGFCYRKVHSIRDRLPVCAPLYALCIPVAENLPAHERGTNHRSNRSAIGAVATVAATAGIICPIDMAKS